jgi:hypothetical protein
VAPLIGGWLVVSLPHDDSLCSRQGAMLTQLDAVSRADFYISSSISSRATNTLQHSIPPLGFPT